MLSLQRGEYKKLFASNLENMKTNLKPKEVIKNSKIASNTKLYPIQNAEKIYKKGSACYMMAMQLQKAPWNVKLTV